MYVQLVETGKNEILQQRFTSDENPSLDYYREKVWWVSDGLDVVLSRDSDYCQPDGFFAPLLKGTVVRIYIDIEMDLMAVSTPFYEGEIENAPTIDKGSSRFFAVTSTGLWVACSEM